MNSVINAVSRAWYSKGLALLIVRVATGLVFLMHGVGKLSAGPMVAGMMMHFGLPDWMGPFITYLEVIGGVALILGVLPRLLGLAFGIEMLVAIFLTGIAKGYSSHELELLLMLLSFAIALGGGGKFALFSMQCKHCGGMLCDGKDGCPQKMSPAGQ